MARVKYILSNINLLNVLLAGFILFSMLYTIMPFINRSIRSSLPATQKHDTVPSGADTIPEQAKPLSPLDYALIAEQNLFHPERKIPLATKNAQTAEKPDFILYGTLVAEGLKMAFLDDLKAPYSTRGRGKRQRALKVGQSLSGYTLAEVLAEKIVMVKGDERIIVAVNDPSKPRRIVKEQATQKQAKETKEAAEGSAPQKAFFAESFSKADREQAEMQKKNKKKNR
ncbi:MAG: hypothetical protein HZB31_14395 [Nitrospirae bacterium]|nr:hypothetical protein [Nitrospirota bacterium]